jgi:hypothetical protein
MGIEIGRPPAARLYDAIGQVVNGLNLGERLALFNAMKAGIPYRDLDPRLRQAFEQACELMRRGGGV